MTNQRGISSLITVILILALILILLATLASQALLRLERQKAATDSIITGYASESYINDLLSKILNFNFAVNTDPITLPDGTIITISTSGTNPQTITITANRPNASNTINVQREFQEAGINEIELSLSLDCTGSMSSLADSTNASTAALGSRFTAEKAAVKAFINSVINDESVRTKTSIGLSVFKANSNWLILPTKDHVQVLQKLDEGYPDNVLRCIDIKEITEYNTKYDPDAVVPPPPAGGCSSAYTDSLRNPPACIAKTLFNPTPGPSDQTILFGGTSISSGIIFAQDTIPTPASNKKQAIIVFTDGTPNVAIDDPKNICNAGNTDGYYCSNDTMGCLVSSEGKVSSSGAGYGQGMSGYPAPTGPVSIGQCPTVQNPSSTNKTYCDYTYNYFSTLYPTDTLPTSNRITCKNFIAESLTTGGWSSDRLCRPESVSSGKCWVADNKPNTPGYPNESCTNLAINQISCALKKSPNGRRNPNLNIYIITVAKNISQAAKDIFINQSDGFFDNKTSTASIVESLKEILSDVLISSSIINISR